MAVLSSISNENFSNQLNRNFVFKTIAIVAQ